MGTPFKSSQWRVWAQPDGPNTDMVLLGCIDTGDLGEPGGGIKDVIRCFRDDGTGWDVLATTHNPPDAITITLTDLVQDTASYLETLKEQDCPFPLYVNGKLCPPHDVFPGGRRTYALQEATIGPITLSGLAMREEDTATTRQAEISAWPPKINYRYVTGARLPIGEYSQLNAIHFCNVKQCAGDCGDAMGPCEVGVAVSNAPAGSPAVEGDVWYTLNNGALWTAAVALPFAAAVDIMGGVCFPISDTVTRILVAAEAQAGLAAQVAYSDDWGANWTVVTLATPVNVGCVDGDGLFVQDMYHIWWCGDLGHIAFSNDGGATWTMQQAGADRLVLTDLYAIWFVDASVGMCVGANDVVLTSTDGGQTWEAGTATGSGAALWTVTENAGGGIWWVGSTNGRSYVSTDHGVTWAADHVFVNTAVVHCIRFVNHLAGWAICYDNIYRTKNGGTDWEEISTIGAAGFRDLHACTENMAFAVGVPTGVGETAALIRVRG